MISIRAAGRFAGVAMTVWAAALAHAQTAAAPPPRPSTLFAEARREIASLPPAPAADLTANLANQELIAGSPEAVADFKLAFVRARALPVAQTGEKATLEADTLEGLLALGDLDGAEQELGMADAGRHFLCDRLIPAELERGRTVQAGALWPPCGSDPAQFPFHAALVLAQQTGASTDLGRQAVAAIPKITSTTVLDQAWGFVQAVWPGRPQESPTPLAAAALASLQKVLPATTGSAWEARQVAAGLAKRLHQPVTATATAMPQSDTPTWLASMLFEPPSEGDIVDFAGSLVADNTTGGELDKNTLEFEQGRFGRSPLSAITLAAAHFELNRLTPFPHLVNEGLANIAASLAAGHSLDGSSPPDMLRAAALAGELDFHAAGPWALSLPPVWLKPVMLAQVAASAATAPDLHPGQTVVVMHGYWPAMDPHARPAIQLKALDPDETTRQALPNDRARASMPIVDYAANRLIYMQPDVEVWVDIGASPHYSFLIAGLVNPTLELVRGARVTITYANLGAGAPDVQFLPHGPPFGLWPNTPIGAWGRLARYGAMDFRGGGIPLLPPPGKTTVFTVRLTFDVPRTGREAYLTNAKGMADAGCYGGAVVVP